ncbi:hypothetical protein HMPREF9120_02595 [Neisseria sp. oral taxon 020 str. F0370]|nr:hypothetical protein HMPREF9120_02595 [Neisseria sp. oral taxon 020 str. F0370]
MRRFYCAEAAFQTAFWRRGYGTPLNAVQLWRQAPYLSDCWGKERPSENALSGLSDGLFVSDGLCRFGFA